MKSNKVHRLDLGDGTFVESDPPPMSISRAQKRMSDAFQQGREPYPEDAEKVLRWLDKQHEKYGGPQRWESSGEDDVESYPIPPEGSTPESISVVNQLEFLLTKE